MRTASAGGKAVDSGGTEEAELVALDRFSEVPRDRVAFTEEENKEEEVEEEEKE